MKLRFVFQIVLLSTLLYYPCAIVKAQDPLSGEKDNTSGSELAPVSFNPNPEGINQLKSDISAKIDQEVGNYSDLCAGVTIGVVSGGSIVYTKSYGTHQVGEVRQWGSVSKTLTTLIVMRQVEKGKLSLTTPIWQYAPQYYAMIPDPYKVTPLTLQHLLTHRGGISHLSNSNTPQMFIAVPDTARNYSSNGFGIVGEVLRTKFGNSFTSFVQTDIADSIGATSLTAPDSFLAPAALVQSNIQDFSRYTIGVMQNSYVSADMLYNVILKPYGPSWQGLGFQIAGSGTNIAAMHAGENAATKTYIYIKPRLKRSVAIFCTAKTDWPEISPLNDLAESIDKIVINVTPTTNPCADPTKCKSTYLPIVIKP
jgi:CubicO group peptidase (beta-lactamase class C family)